MLPPTIWWPSRPLRQNASNARRGAAPENRGAQCAARFLQPVERPAARRPAGTTHWQHAGHRRPVVPPAVKRWNCRFPVHLSGASVMSAVTSAAPVAVPQPKGYVPAVGPRLKKLLLFVFALVALLGANSLYLVSITILEWRTALTFQNYFYQVMFLLHLALGLLLLV